METTVPTITNPVLPTRLDELDYRSLARTSLFLGASEDEVRAMLRCLDARVRMYAKGECVYQMGDLVKSMGLVLEGSVRIENVDAWGNVSVLGRAAQGQVFAEAYACLPGEPLLVDVVAAEACRVLMLDVSRIVGVCSSACVHHTRLLLNLLSILSRKNLESSRRGFHTAPKTIRGKVLAYLSYLAAQQGSRCVEVPFNRQQLADYLGVDRSALSTELTRMQNDGLVEVRRNSFALLA